MDFFTYLQQFHFLRPAWLLLLLPAAFLMWSVYQRSDSLRAWKRIINPKLLRHLLLQQGNDGGRWRPAYFLGIAWFLGIISLAGPSWQMQTSPFSEDQAALFIVLKVTPEMQAQDIQPSRLQRSVIKIHDLLDLNKDLRTGLIAYAGSAHLVMPLTSDAGIINTFASALEPAAMPLEGDETAEAIALASDRIRNSGVPGSIILITDAVDSSQLEELKKTHQQTSVETHILAVAAGPDAIPPAGSYPAPALDLKSLRDAASVLGGSVTTVTADKSDIENLAAKVERSISHVAAHEGQQWKDQGYSLLFLLAFFMLPFFRRGGSVAIK